MKTHWKQLLRPLLSGIILVSSAAQMASATSLALTQYPAETAKVEQVAKLSASPCAQLKANEITNPECDSSCDIECTLCLYGMIANELEILQIASLTLPHQPISYRSIPRLPPTPPPNI